MPDSRSPADNDSDRGTDWSSGHHETAVMNTQFFSAIVIAMVLASPVTSAQQQVTQTAPGAGQPAAGGKGPGMGYSYRRNSGGPGVGRGAQPGQVQTGKVQRTAEPPPPRATPGAPPQPPATPASDPSLQAAPGHLGYPAWGRGPAAPYGQPMPRYMRPGRQGYGYPGYRGQGGSPYPGHRQYGNPPGIPSGAAPTD